MSTETQTNPQVADAPPCWPPVAHIIDKREVSAEYALCGAKLMGIVLDNAEKVCVKCIEEWKRREGIL